MLRNTEPLSHPLWMSILGIKFIRDTVDLKEDREIERYYVFVLSGCHRTSTSFCSKKRLIHQVSVTICIRLDQDTREAVYVMEPHKNICGTQEVVLAQVLAK